MDKERIEADFTRAYETHADAIFRHCFFRLSDREKAFEIMQETFMRTWDYLQSGKEVTQLKPFLYRVATNLVIEEYRKRKTVSLDAYLEVDGHDESLVEGLRDEESYERLIDALDGKEAMRAFQILPPKFRDVLVWRYVDGLSLHEIAQICRERENTISVRIHRALKVLKDVITKEV